MIYYTLDSAIGAMEPEDDLCVSTDDSEILQVVKDYGVKVPFVRPSPLASDTAGSKEVIQHAIDWYMAEGKKFDVVILLQVTSPLRNAQHIKEALGLWEDHLDMVVSVKETDANPYYVLFEEDKDGFLQRSKKGSFTRRQDCPKVYELNGAIYIMHPNSIKGKSEKKMKKYAMSKLESVDIDDRIDLIFAETLLKEFH